MPREPRLHSPRYPGASDSDSGYPPFIKKTVMNIKSIAGAIRNESLRVVCFLRTGYYSRGERVNPDVPDANFQNHLKAYCFIRQFAAQKDVLDVGCGTGYGTAHLAEVAKSAVGIDISEAAVKWATKRYPSVPFVCMDAQRLEFPDRSFDLIVSAENFEHLSDQAAHARELARVLRHDGLCFVATPNPEMFVGHHNPYHTKENSFAELSDLFRPCFRKLTIVENTEEPDTPQGKAMREKRREAGEVGEVSFRDADATWLHNTHSFFCFCEQPQPFPE
jgi:SAM-dependent methyltransferase